MKACRLYLFLALMPMVSMAQPKPVSALERKAMNVSVFARVYGYVRYFYPGDETKNLDWNSFKLYALPRVERAKTPEDLKSTLDSLFQPLAPGLVIYDESKPVPFDKSLLLPGKKDTSKLPVVSWQHLGLGTPEQEIYKDFKIGRAQEYTEDQVALFTTIIPADSFRGKRFFFRGGIKYRPTSEYAYGGLYFKVNRANNQPPHFYQAEGQAGDMQWHHDNIDDVIDDDAESICLGVWFSGSGQLWADDLTFFTRNDDDDDWIYENKFDGDFETTKNGALPKHWSVPDINQKYKIETTDHDSYLGKKSVMIASKSFLEPLFKEEHHFGDYLQKSLGNHLACTMPLALFGDSKKTYPVPDKRAYKRLLQAIAKKHVPAEHPDNTYERLSTAIELWNVYEHFYPYFGEAGIDWMQQLPNLIKETYLNDKPNAFKETLEKYIALTHDAQGTVLFSDGQSKPFFRPFNWAWIESKLVITDVFDKKTNLLPGDIVQKINGQDAKSYLMEIMQHIPAATEAAKYAQACANIPVRDSDTRINLTVLGADGKVVKLACKQNFMGYRDSYNSPNDWTSRKMEEGIYYINLNNFSSLDLDSLMPRFLKAQSIICDLRGIPLSSPVLLQHLLLQDDTSNNTMRVPKIINPDHEFSGFWKKKQQLFALAPRLTAKMVFITDERTVGYAESFVTIIKENHLGTMVGAPTGGIDGMPNECDLGNGCTLSFTGMKVIKPDGSTLFGVGYAPDIPVSRTIKGVSEGRDELLEKALEEARK